jgi:hypothetical protein
MCIVVKLKVTLKNESESDFDTVEILKQHVQFQASICL